MNNTVIDHKFLIQAPFPTGRYSAKHVVYEVQGRKNRELACFDYRGKIFNSGSRRKG